MSLHKPSQRWVRSGWKGAWEERASPGILYQAANLLLRVNIETTSQNLDRCLFASPPSSCCDLIAPSALPGPFPTPRPRELRVGAYLSSNSNNIQDCSTPKDSRASPQNAQRGKKRQSQWRSQARLTLDPTMHRLLCRPDGASNPTVIYCTLVLYSSISRRRLLCALGTDVAGVVEGLRSGTPSEY